MSAVGGASENMAMLIFTYNPPFVGFWLISWVILNVSPSFSPMALTSHFYRYGYMMPIHSSNEITKSYIFGYLERTIRVVLWVISCLGCC